MLGNENLFLIVLAFVWIIGAILQDFKRREVDNLWNFSLIAFALAYRLSVSVFSSDYLFFLNGLIGFAVFLFLGNLFYYARLFAGGDAKLFIAMGAILPLSINWMVNFKIFGAFILLFFLTGSIYAFIWSFVLMFKRWTEFKKEFLKQWKVYRRLFIFALIFVLLWMIVVFLTSQIGFILIGLVVLLFPFLFIYAKSIEEVCMIKLVKSNEVTIGDWLYQDIKIGRKTIKACWDGISKKELELIKKNGKKVLIKQGIPFTPSFLFALIGLLYLMEKYKMFF